MVSFSWCSTRLCSLTIAISYLNTVIKHWKVHHFADDTNLLHINDSIKKFDKAVNSDLKNLTNWLNSNKFSLNVSKAELILFTPQMKKLDFVLKLKLNSKRIYPTKSVKYLGIETDEKTSLGLIILMTLLLSSLTWLMLWYLK